MAQRTFAIEIDGMSCDGCVTSVRKVLGRIRGAVVNDVTVGSASVALDENDVTERDVLAAIDKAGFTARIAAPR